MAQDFSRTADKTFRFALQRVSQFLIARRHSPSSATYTIPRNAFKFPLFRRTQATITLGRGKNGRVLDWFSAPIIRSRVLFTGPFYRKFEHPTRVSSKSRPFLIDRAVPLNDFERKHFRHRRGDETRRRLPRIASLPLRTRDTFQQFPESPSYSLERVTNAWFPWYCETIKYNNSPPELFAFLRRANTITASRGNAERRSEKDE